MTISDIVILTEFETGTNDWLDGSAGLCWPRYFLLWNHFYRIGMLSAD